MDIMKKKQKTFLMVIGIILAVAIVAVGIFLCVKNGEEDKTKDSASEQNITSEEDLDKDNVVDGSELFDDEDKTAGPGTNQENSHDQSNTGNSNSQNNTGNDETNSNNNGSDNVVEDDTNDDKVDDNEDNQEDNQVEDLGGAEWTPNY